MSYIRKYKSKCLKKLEEISVEIVESEIKVEKRDKILKKIRQFIDLLDAL